MATDEKPLNLLPGARRTRKGNRNGGGWRLAPSALTLLRNRRRQADDSAGIPEGGIDQGLLHRDAVYRRLLAAGDVLSAAVAVAGVVALGDGDSLRLEFLAALPLVVLVSKTIGLYDRDENRLKKTTLDEAPALFQVATLYALVIWLGESIFVSGELGKLQVLSLWIVLFGSMLLARTGARVLARLGSSAERCLVVGGPEAAEHLRTKLDASPAHHALVVGRVPVGKEELDDAGPELLGPRDALGLVLVEQGIDRAIIAPGPSDSQQVLDVIRLVRSLGIKVSVLPRLFEVVGSSVEFDDVEGALLLGLRREGLTKSSRLLKRGMDVVAASAGLVVLTPLLLLITAAIKLGSPGPALFRQARVGRDGTEFEIVKFRTMVDGADQRKAELAELNETDGVFKMADDPRTTRVGRFLRRSSLDELPQLFNVLRGEMSLVGPRPLVPDEDRRVEGWDRRRLQVTPGMTGVWQIFGPTRIPLQEMVKIDYLYGANWSLWGDVKILLRTIPHAFARRGL